MRSERLFKEVSNEWSRIAGTQPNERLPREEQTRCIIYALLRPDYEVLCAERGYGPVDSSSFTTCDLWGTHEGSPDMFMEIKHAWESRSLNNKPTEQYAKWLWDLTKLEGVTVEADRYFVLVGFFETDPLTVRNPPLKSVLACIGRLPVARLVHQESASCQWRSEHLHHVAVWVWHWPAGDVMEDFTSL